MRLSELKEKEVINCCDCERLGYICDIEFDFCSGCIQKIILPGPCKLWGILGYEEEYIIPLCQIKQIGTDIILVEVRTNEILVSCKE